MRYFSQGQQTFCIYSPPAHIQTLEQEIPTSAPQYLDISRIVFILTIQIIAGILLCHEQLAFVRSWKSATTLYSYVLDSSTELSESY